MEWRTPVGIDIKTVFHHGTFPPLSPNGFFSGFRDPSTAAEKIGGSPEICKIHPVVPGP